ncbi:alpha/beta fold hydrolase [Streptomyces klenkii]|uniref:alpha/beta fold hydrolase n=1 Tax=Streptomyces klenkii TaxID=1420899 RepID=UPI003441F716
MAVIDASGLALHVARIPARTAGTAPPSTVVLVHGMLVDSLISYYFTLAPRFAAAGLDVIMYDLRGQGLSERPSDGYRLEDHLDDLEALLDRLDPAGPVHLVGNSYGGTIAFGHAARHPGRVASVSMIESEPATGARSRKMADNLTRGAESELAAQEGRLRSLLPGCRTAVIPGQEHWVLVGATELTGDLILDWIRAHTPGPAAGDVSR